MTTLVYSSIMNFRACVDLCRHHHSEDTGQSHPHQTRPVLSFVFTHNHPRLLIFSVPEFTFQECLTSGVVRWVAFRAGSLHSASCRQRRVVAGLSLCEVAFHPRLEQSLQNHLCVGSHVNSRLCLLGMNTQEWGGQVIVQVHVYFIRKPQNVSWSGCGISHHKGIVVQYTDPATVRILTQSVSLVAFSAILMCGWHVSLWLSLAPRRGW